MLVACEEEIFVGGGRESGVSYDTIHIYIPTADIKIWINEAHKNRAGCVRTPTRSCCAHGPFIGRLRVAVVGVRETIVLLLRVLLLNTS